MRIGITISLLLVSIITMAIPARRVKKTITLKDGTAVEVILQGDENVHYYLTEDDRRFQFSEATACYEEVDMETINTRWERKLQTRNNLRKSRAGKRKATWGAETNPVSGEKKGLVILVSYADKKMSYTNADYQDYFNKVGYNANGMAGSVHDYFYSSSYGQFDLTFDVVGPVTVSRNLSYYGANDYSGNDKYAAQMVGEAVQLADAEVDFSDYDWDGDGVVEQVFVIYAGYGEAQGAASNTIWPHEYQLSEAVWFGDGPGAITLDGVTIDTYACSCELNGFSGTRIDGIGTACHEFSHCMCIPDMYDTQNRNFGMNHWDLMDYGAYNGPSDNGSCPAPYTSYERMYCGWLTPVELQDPVTIKDMPAITDEPVAYLIRNSGRWNEYYLLENHQKNGWDKYAGGHGMLVLHVDFDSQAWKDNSVNTVSSRQRMTIIAADNSYNSYSLSGDTWPGTGNKTELSDTSTPQARMYNNNANGQKLLGHAITEIQEQNGKISFLFDGGFWVGVPSRLSAETIGPGRIIVRWKAVSGADSYEIEFYDGVESLVRSTTSTSYSFRNLKEDCVYSFRVRALIGDIPGEWSESYLVGAVETMDTITLGTEEGRTPVIFNLQGQRVNGAGKGIYIVDGKKKVLN